MEVKRGVAARLGIVLLNFLAPGLGLLRLGLWKPALFVYGISAGTLLFFHSAPVVPFALLVLAAALTIGALLASLLISWRESRHHSIKPAAYSHWYSVLAAALVSVCVSVFLTDESSRNYRNFYTPGEGMAPTLQKNDRFIAFMGSIAPLRRGDLVLVRAPRGDIYVKRVAALPGDRLAMQAGVILLNGAPIPQRKTGSAQVRDVLGAEAGRKLIEQFPGERVAHEIYDLGESPGDDFPQLIVPAGSVFVLGDNRDRSADSRFPVEMGGLGGPVGLTNVVGRPLYQTWGSSRPTGTKLFD